VKNLKLIAFLLGTLAATSGQAAAADLGALAPSAPDVVVSQLGPHCSRIWNCHGEICHWRRVCWHGCPDRYSCSPLYGAYGPYGGTAYWGAYSYGNLGSYQ
jgi:hypothetical protein